MIGMIRLTRKHYGDSFLKRSTLNTKYIGGKSYNAEITGPKITAVFDSRDGLRSEATTGVRRTKIVVILRSSAAIRYVILIL